MNYFIMPLYFSKEEKNFFLKIRIENDMLTLPLSPARTKQIVQRWQRVIKSYEKAFGEIKLPTATVGPARSNPAYPN